MDFLCSDERIQKSGLANPGSVLFDLIILKYDPEALAARYRAAGVTTIFAHEECGAAKAALGKADATWDEVNTWAQAETKKFCDAHGFQYGYISASEFVPQGHTHPGTTLYVSDIVANRGGYRVSPLVAANPAASTHALLTLVAFKSGNGGGVLRTRTDGSVFRIIIENDAPFDLPELPADIQPFVKVEKVA